LLYGDFQWIANTKDQLVYSRRYFGNYVVVCINKSEEKFSFQFSIPDGFSVSKSQNWSSNTVSTPINQKNKITLNGQGLSSYILTFNQ
jgi:hypothetical protein